MKTDFDQGEDWAHQHVIAVLADRLGLDPNSISPSDRLADLEMDSLDVDEFVMLIEDELDVDVAEEDVTKLETVQDLIDYVRARKK